MRRPATRAACLVVVGLLLVAPAAAQSGGGNETDDHEEQDRRYYERYAAKPAPEPRPEAGEKPSAAFIALAESLVRDKNYRSAENDHFRVQTDDPRLDARVVLARLESFRTFFDEFWRETAPSSEDEAKVRVFLFYSYHDYDRVLEGDWSRSAVRPKGHYGATLGAIALHTDSDRPGGLAETLVHEAAHALIRGRLLGSAEAPAWLDEGLATYFAFTAEDDEGRLVAGEVGGKRPTLLHDGGRASSREPQAALKHLRERMRRDAEGPGSPFLDLLDAGDATAFYAGDLAERYAAAWVLVHFLFHGDSGTHVAGFTRWLGRIGSGEGDLDRLLAEIGMTRDELAAGAQRHLDRLKAR